jgi:hypothetical protein
MTESLNNTRLILKVETDLIHSFILKDRQARYLALIDSEKGRAKLLKEKFPHTTEGDLDSRFAHAIPSNRQTIEEIESLLRSKRAPKDCYAFSDLDSIDAKVLPLGEALEEIVGTGSGFLSCLHGKLAYFEGEAPTTKYICERP